MIEPGLYRFTGRYPGLKYGITCKPGTTYKVEQQGTQQVKGREFAKVIITSHPYGAKQGSALYADEKQFYKQWARSYE